MFQKATNFCKTFDLRGGDAVIEHLEFSIDMLFEEIRETDRAIGSFKIDASPHYINEQLTEDIIDGFGDVAFLALNGIYKTFRMVGDTHSEATRKIDLVMNRICDANLAKFQPDGTVKYNDAGKAQKPDGWVAPSYGDLI